ncbi:hypothetical protein Rhe02_72990 [Rhizocola hellebori]|uniref:Uncharacterized protein n=1 Tax=Rhizocola hellebori TaxID=1392758 RepID=A0A8J3QGI8_9ACTN|nr:T3SS effector HopA1 family protein [Rhizocola hellebori]GIH09232.1 hypothetical protein Rhe02_72990 [Rhizocola hellebori]
MNAHRDRISSAVSAAGVQATSYSWFGRLHRVLPRAAAKGLDPATARSYLVTALQTRLYTNFYCPGMPVPIDDEVQATVGSTSARQPYLQALSEANTGTGCAEGSWRVHGQEGPHTVVEQQGLRLWLTSDDLCAVTGGNPQAGAAGSEVAIRLPKELFERSPGFYVALGNEALPPSAAEPLVRMYWNLTPKATAPAVGILTATLNEARVPFRFKVADTPTRLARCDAGVLYYPKRHHTQVRNVVAEAYAQLRDVLTPGTPAFTKQLAPGLGLAEDFGDGGSFGMHRCGLLAEGVVAAGEKGCRTSDERLTTVFEYLLAAGIDPDAPYLHPGSTDDYATLTTAERTGRR